MRKTITIEIDDGNDDETPDHAESIGAAADRDVVAPKKISIWDRQRLYNQRAKERQKRWNQKVERGMNKFDNIADLFGYIMLMFSSFIFLIIGLAILALIGWVFYQVLR